ncbi:MAG: hypothetical protein HZC41_02355 [Chloroflexi bacterium]|nr:hypothetical protein [Chloroflexota bacterium]
MARKDFVRTYGIGEMWLEGGLVTEYEARVYFWNSTQVRLLKELQNEIEDGWKPITEVGPAAFKVRYERKAKRGLSFIDVLAWFLTFGLVFLYQLLTGFKQYEVNHYEAMEFRVGLSK